MSSKIPKNGQFGVSRRRVLATGAVLSGAALVGPATAETEQDNDDEDDVSIVACGDVINRELTPEDETGFRSDLHYHDAYGFDCEQGEFVSISMSVMHDDGDEPDDNDYEPPGGPYLYLLGPDGTIVAEDDDSGGDLNAHITVPRLPESGRYTIVATSWGEEDFFEYRLAVECGDPFDREPIACDETVVGELTPDDPTGFLSDEHAHDAYGFEGTAGEFVEISMDGLDVPINDDCDTTFPDPLLVLLDPDLELIAWDDDSGGNLNARINTRLPMDGSYTLIATSWAPRMYFAYELSLACRAPRDPEPIECGETIAGELSLDDDSGIRNEFGRHVHDTYVFEGAAGEYVTITMQADRFATNHEHHDYPLGDPYLYLFDPDGQLIAEDDDSAGDFGAMIQQLLRSDGEYVIVATSFDAGEFFPYELTLACEDEGPPLPEPIAIECGETVLEAIEPTDSTGFLSPGHFHDHYEFEGAAGDLVTLSMSSTDGDPFVVLLDPESEIVAWDDDSGGGFDALISNVELDANGTYSIVATSFGPAQFFDYELTIQCL